MTEYRFGDICKVINGRAYRQPELLDAGKYPVLRVGNFFSSDRWFYSDLELPEDKYCDNGDLLFAWSASFGPRIWNAGKVIYHYHIWKLVPNEEIVDKYYLYYWLRKSVNILTAGTHGSVMAHMTKGDMENQRILLPSIEVQRKVGNVLRILDDKIVTNSKINDNLQQQAQAIYSAMFISNADPAWVQGRLSDLITVKYGKDHKKLADGAYPVFGSGGIMRYVERPLYTGESVLIPRKGTLNNVMYVNEPFWSVDTMFFTEMKIPNVAKFVFHFVKAKDLASMNAGSAVPSMTTDILNAMELAIPSAERLAEFESVVAPMYQAMQANNRESSKLAELRDSLLPKLMSGEVDVSSIQI